MRIQYSILISQMGGAAVEGVLVRHRVTNLIGQEPRNSLGCGAFSLKGGKSPSQTGMNWSSYVTPTFSENLWCPTVANSPGKCFQMSRNHGLFMVEGRDLNDG